ncbi:MAG: endo alpha-1,4 polygalactosaminidase [Planctomycetota bacterium]|jgi:cysteinyl-tRNA synthetase
MTAAKGFTTADPDAEHERRRGCLDMGRFVLLLVALLACCAAPGRRTRLREVRTWAMQLQGLEKPGAVRLLRISDYDLLVVDAPDSVRGLESFDTARMVARLQPRHLCLAYLNVGQAEEYRTYWRKDWVAPGRDRPGTPPFLLTVDPDGWVGDYPVAYWDPSWKRILLARVERLAALGFDGVYCDWVLGFEEPAVVAAATRRGVDPAREMAALLRDLKKAGDRSKPGFLLMMQNGGRLFGIAPQLRAWVDGYAQECVSFRGEAGSKWTDPAAADIPLPAKGGWSTQALLERLQFVRGQGLPVFTVDYATKYENIELARHRARQVVAVPFVSRAPLDRLP